MKIEFKLSSGTLNFEGPNESSIIKQVNDKLPSLSETVINGIKFEIGPKSFNRLTIKDKVYTVVKTRKGESEPIDFYTLEDAVDEFMDMALQTI